jgi:hypothetical protein
MNRDEILKRAIETYGEEHQLNKLQEECAELIAAISRYRENPVEQENYINVIEEAVDVETVLLQLLNYAFPDQVVEYIRYDKAEKIGQKVGREGERR